MKIRAYLIVIPILLVIGTLGFSSFEGASLLDSFYFTVVTIATVGYGDLHPATLPGKMLSIFLIVTGVGTFTAALASGTNFILNRKQQAERLQKLNVIISLFFSEMGVPLLKILADKDGNTQQIQEAMLFGAKESPMKAPKALETAKEYEPEVFITPGFLEELGKYLDSHQDFILRILENPLLFEHESFTDLLRAILHLKEEIAQRPYLASLPDTDIKHLHGDISRAYKRLLIQYLFYVKYLAENYPYLHSLAMRTNPFDQEASPIVRD